MTPEPSGLPGNIQVVEPGSPGDPFSTNNQNVAPPVDPAATGDPAPASQPVTSDAITNIAALLKDPEVVKVIDATVNERVSRAQSGLDKLNRTLKQNLEATKAQAEAAEKKATRLERQVQLSNLTDTERAAQLQQFDYEDKEDALKVKAKGVDDYYRSVTALDLVNKYGMYGFSEEDIGDDDTVEEMEIKALRKQNEFYVGKVPASAGPAAASAPSDLGAGGPAAPAFKLGTEQGRDSMAANLKALMGRPEKVL